MQRLLLLATAAGALILLVPLVKQSRSQLGTIALTAAVAMSIYLAKSVDKVPGTLIAYGRRMAVSAPNATSSKCRRAATRRRDFPLERRRV